MISAGKLLWVDCTAAAIAGVAVLALSAWLSRLHMLPRELLLFIGAVNLAYACYSFTLAHRAHRPILLIKILVLANVSWVIVLLGLAVTFWNHASPFGIAHLVGEAMVVGALAAMEWNQRYQLVAAPRVEIT
ncbi:hypothetical protein BH23DEI1_BH23DEI1_12900 [soil metagenome]|nr:hypothetical protein [Trueperaceae bacterium]